MPPGEKVNLLVMRDNGEVRSLRMRLSLLVTLCSLCAIMPFVAGAGIWFSVDLWMNQAVLGEANYRLSRESMEARAKAERLGNLEHLLQRDVAVESIVVSNVNKPATKVGAEAPKPEDEQASAMQEGPGHSEFPTIATGFITLDNINVRQQPGNKLRMSMDLRNPDSKKAVSGIVSCTMITAAGETVPLQFRPADAGDFRITRLKRAVLVSVLPPQTNFTNAQVVVEVKSDSGELVYRNVFPVER